MKTIKKRGAQLNIGLIIMIIGYMILVLVPLMWIVTTSLKTNMEFTSSPWGFPAEPQWINYFNAWVDVNFKTYALNSVYITIASVGLIVLIGAPTAYILTRLKIRWRRVLLFLFIAGLYIPIAMVLPTEFLTLKTLNLYNTQIGLILLYVVFSLPYSILVLNGFYKTLPKEIEEAAEIDGCSRNKMFWEIIFPMSRNGIATIMILNLIWIWNDYIFALTFLSDKGKMTLPVGLIGLMQSFKLRADWVTLFAGLCFVMIPSIILFLIFNKNMTRGLTAGALKE